LPCNGGYRLEITIIFWGFPLAKKSSSAEKRHRQSEERRMRNKAAKSAVRTSVKKFIALVQAKDQAARSAGVRSAGAHNAAAPDAAATEAALKDMVKKIDTAARKGIIKKNAAARKKSRMQRFYNSHKAAQ
jgi:small subunit ribosomal protein S20